jgi:hypothetical protein
MAKSSAWVLPIQATEPAYRRWLLVRPARYTRTPVLRMPLSTETVPHPANPARSVGKIDPAARAY